MNVHAPMKTIQPRTNYKNWLKTETKQRMSDRDRAREQARETDTEQNWSDYRKIRNECTMKQRQDKKDYMKDIYKKIEEEDDTTKLFSMTKNLMGGTNLGPPTSLRTEQGIIRKQKDMANCLASYYSEKIKKIKSKLPRVNGDPLEILRRLYNRWDPELIRPQFKLRSVSELEVGKLISKLKNSHAFGIDRIDAATLKIAAGILIPSITHVINLSLSSGKFPARWKLARVLPLRKGKESERNNPASYRPICLLPVVSKLAERVVQCQVLKYLEETSQISDQHHAYRENHNTSTALIQMMDAIASASDENLITSTMNIDLTAAFDCVPHGTLLEKLEFYGLDRLTKDWIKSYLHARSSFVVIGSAESFITNTPQGVPQGSVLGPLLYLIFVNEMTCITEDKDCTNNAHVRKDKLFPKVCQNCGIFPLYADDGQFQISSNYREWNQDKLNQNFWKIKNFLNANGLQVNEGKTRLVEFMIHQKRTKSKGKPPELLVNEDTEDRNGRTTIQDKIITDNGYCRMLGLNMKNDLSWDTHLNRGKKALLPALRRQIGMLTRIGQNLSKRARLNIVNGFIMSRLSYMICIWGNTNDSQVRKVQTLQNSAARLVSKLPRRTRQKDLLESCGWLNIKNLTEYHSLCQLWKTIRWNAPSYLKDKLEIMEEDKIRTGPPRLLITSLSYRWNTVDKWNSLPEELRTEPTIKRFKLKLKKWLKDRNVEDRPPDVRDGEDRPQGLQDTE